MKRFATISAALFVCFASGAAAQDIPAEYQQVLTTLGKQGDYKANVLKVNIPRNDISVTVANVKTPTPVGFGGWIAMTKGTGGMDVMMGDLYWGHRTCRDARDRVQGGRERVGKNEDRFGDQAVIREDARCAGLPERTSRLIASPARG